MATVSTTPFKDYKNPLVALQAQALYSFADGLAQGGNVNAAEEIRKIADSTAAMLVPKSSSSRAPVKRMLNGAAEGLGTVQQYLSKAAKDALETVVASLHAAANTIDDKAQAALGDVLDAIGEMIQTGLVNAVGDAQMVFQALADAVGELKATLEETDITVPVRDVVSAIANALSSLTTSSPISNTNLLGHIQEALATVKQRRQERRANRGTRQRLTTRIRRTQETDRQAEGIVKNFSNRIKSRLRLRPTNTTGDTAGSNEEATPAPAPAPVLEALRGRTRRPRSGIAPSDTTANDVQVPDPVVVEILRYIQPLLNGTPLETTEFVLFVAPHDAAVKVATMAVNHGMIKPERYSALVERLDRLYNEAKYNPVELSDAAIYGGTRIAVPIGMGLAAIVVQILNSIIEIVIDIVYQIVVKLPGINFIPLPATLPPLLTAFATPLITGILRNDTLQAYLAVAVYLLLDVPFEVADRLAVRVFERLTPEDVNTVRSRVFHTLITNLEAI